MQDSYDKEQYQSSQKKSVLFQENQQASEHSAQQRQCPNCGWGVPSGDADICENCGEWLLKGQCNFCYAQVEEGQNFCADCGNPPEGIICRQCGQLSHFDFCPQCSIPLTEQAEETLELIQNSAEVQELLQINEDDLEPSGEPEEQTANELDKLTRYLAKLDQQSQKKSKQSEPRKEGRKREKFVLQGDAGPNVEDRLKLLEQSPHNEKQKAFLERKKEIQAMEMLKNACTKSFANNQEARRFFEALRQSLFSALSRHPMGWMCNAYGVVHDYPQECSATSRGGIWLYKSKDGKGLVLDDQGNEYTLTYGPIDWDKF